MTNLTVVQPQRVTAFEPANLVEAMRFAEILADSSMVPKEFQGKPGNVLVALQWGREVGLGPLQSLQSIAVINGRATMWGDAILALVRAHPAFVSILEGVEGEGDERHGFCEVVRRGADPVRREYSVADAKRAKLWGKRGRDGQDTPWITNPDRMLQMRARGFCLRDTFTDALRGMISREEAADYAELPREVPNLAAEAPTHAPAPAAPRGAIVAQPGSMLEYAAQVSGREVRHPAEEPPAEAADALPLVYLDSVLRAIGPGAKSGAPAIAIWRHAAGQQVARAETRAALRGWRQANGPHFGAIAGQFPAAVAEVERAVEARLAEMFGDEAPAAEEAEEGSAEPNEPEAPPPG